MKEVSIIIINYNTSHHTINCVKSVIEYSADTDFEIVVVDNNSNDEDYKKLKNGLQNFEKVKLHRSIINTGFGGGNMLGCQFAKAKYLLFLNNDAFFQNDCLSILKNYMNKHSHIGCATAQNFDENNQFVPSFDHFKGIRKLLFGRSFLEKYWPNENPKRKKEYDKPVTVNMVNGAFMFFRSEVFAAVGGFDNHIFLYFEEMDICYRLLKAGYKSALVPQAKIMHYQGASTGKSSKTLSKEGFISYLYVISKNYSFMKRNFIKIYFLITYLVKPSKWFLYKALMRSCHGIDSLRLQQIIKF